MSQQSSRSGLSFFGMIGIVMGALKLKQHWDEYNPLATEEEGRVALAATPLESAPPYNEGDEASIALLDTETRPRRKRQSGCCVCCGINCSLFWKAFGIVVTGLAIWNAVKLIMWAVSSTPTGLEGMPAFSSSLGCQNAPHIYNSTKVVMTARIGKDDDHSFDLRGSAVGTFIIAQGPADLQDIKYEMTIRTADASLLDDIDVHYPDVDVDGSVLTSRLMITTPRTGPEAGCMRYDIIMYVPPTLKKLHVASHAIMHLQFDADADIEIDSLFVTMFTMDKSNLILPNKAIRGNHMALEVFRGWIVGDVAIVNSTSLTSQRGDGVINVRAHPTTPLNPQTPDPAYLRTTTGAGRTDIFYIGSKAFKRPISNVHMSSRNADMYLTYRDAEYNGRVELDSKSYTATGLKPFMNVPSDDQGGGAPRWTHWAGDMDGGDQILVKSRGWSGLYF